MSLHGTAKSGLSIVCVFNDPEVRADCLDRSLRAYSGGVRVDYVRVDNTAHAFTTAGAALNHGARLARHDVVAFVHQDVYLHSVERLAAAAEELLSGGWGMLGASGVAHDGEFVGRLRDRVEVIGRPTPRPGEVDSLDEVLFMVGREQVLAYPLTEDRDLAWHAYAIEYGLRLRGLGLRVGAMDLAITHNSLTINLARLDVAHRVVAARFPADLPLHTTCGMIGARPDSWRRAPVLKDHRWRLRWLARSVTAARIARRLGVPVVIADIRHDVDLLGFSGEAPLYVVSLDRAGGLAEHQPDDVELSRLGKPVVVRAAADLAGLIAGVGALPPETNIVVTNLREEELETLATQPRGWVVGLQAGEMWALGGPVARQLPDRWREPRAVPLGAKRDALAGFRG